MAPASTSHDDANSGDSVPLERTGNTYRSVITPLLQLPTAFTAILRPYPTLRRGAGAALSGGSPRPAARQLPIWYESMRDAGRRKDRIMRMGRTGQQKQKGPAIIIQDGTKTRRCAGGKTDDHQARQLIRRVPPPNWAPSCKHRLEKASTRRWPASPSGLAPLPSSEMGKGSACNMRDELWGDADATATLADALWPQGLPGLARRGSMRDTRLEQCSKHGLARDKIQ